MSARTDYALAHPITDPRGALDPALAEQVTVPGGNLLRSILAVDR